MVDKLRAALLAAMLASVATPAPAETPNDFIDFMNECSRRGILADCMAEYFRRTLPPVAPYTGRPAVPLPTPRPPPAPTPREWRI
jgi:hypothetical protein